MGIERLTTGGEIGQGLALLLLTAYQHRQHRRDKPTTPLTLGAKTDFAPQHRAAEIALRYIIGRVNALHAHERPQRGRARE